MAVFISPAIECGVNGAYDLTMTIKLSSFGERVSWLLRRPEIDMSQKQLAATLGVSEQFMSALIKGKSRPNVAHVRRIASVLHTSVDFLTLNSDDPAPSAEPEPPIYFSAEADEAARLIDAMPRPTPGFAPSCASPSSTTACSAATGYRRTADRALIHHSTP